MAGKKGRSGRRKSAPTLIKEALDLNDEYLPQYLEELRNIAFDEKASIRDRRECLEYLLNRSMGSPKAQTDLRVKGEFQLTADEYREMGAELDRVRAEERDFIQENTHKLLPGTEIADYPRE